ncbi:alanine racemase [Romboutsia sp. 1001216sp1]|uniref:alanine racemase n=1 Tax=Romboutsia sp. 1001216sp1 TaxID=2986997 RepID=UPI00232E62F0|nr:alanine racemase [Romboutsia sp. 1001216sp1]MDB8791178.1 alanine racemase [Romboutsia sp. 1001216sp1]
MSLLRPTYVQINLDNIKHNLQEIKKYTKNSTKIGAVLKSNAYGHGSIEIAKLLCREGIDYLCVATLSEALEFRRENIKSPILVMGYIPNEHIELAVENNITITVIKEEQGKIINNICSKINKIGKVHIKLDTGFNRLGLKVNQNTFQEIYSLLLLKNLYIEGIFSHLALRDEKSDYIQFNIFKKTINELEKIKTIPIKHICDSIGFVSYKDFHMDMVRIGASIYGYNNRDSSLQLKPAITFKSKIIQVKEVRGGEAIGYDYSYVANKNIKIGIIPCGYGDGIPRSLSNKGYVDINNKRCNIIGKICMDYLVIDISYLDKCDYDADVVFYGENGPTLLEIANLIDTNRNELLSLISRRVDRVYIENGEIKKILNYIY